MKSILFYGDSNTWGYDPATSLRYPYETRWTTVCAKDLGSGFDCIPAGMNGRTTVFDDPMKGARNGLKGLDYELQANKPLDLFAVMLGTNDLKYTDAEGCAEGMERLIEEVLSVNERFASSSPVFSGGFCMKPILLISPVLLKAHVGELREDILNSKRLSVLYRRIAEKHGLSFMDAAKYAEASDIDGIHLNAESHISLGHAVSKRILGLFSEDVRQPDSSLSQR